MGLINENSTHHLRQLVSLYFSLGVKNPMKIPIQKYFKQFNEQEKIVEIFCDEIQKLLEINHEEKTVEYRLVFISLINDSSQNFTIAIKAIRKQAGKIMDFTNILVKDLMNSLKIEKSIVSRNQISYQLHCCLQAFIFCVKAPKSEKEITSKKNECKYLNEIVRICWIILEEDTGTISIETKNVCSLLIGIKYEMNYENILLHIENNKEKSIKKLCLIFGVIKTMNTVDFSLISKLCQIMYDEFTKNSVNPAISSSVSSLFLLLSKKISTAEAHMIPHNIHLIAISILEVAFCNLDHYVDAIRFNSKETIKTTIAIGVRINNQIIIDDFFYKVKHLSSTSTMATVIIIALNFLSTEKVISIIPGFTLHELLSTENYTIYESFANTSFNKLAFKEWVQIFIEPVLNKIKDFKSDTLDSKFKNLKKLFFNCAKKDWKVLEIVISTRNEYEMGFFLLCVNIAKKEGILKMTQSNNSIWKGIMPFEDIKKCMVNIDSEVRMQTVNLIIDSKKTTEKFSIQEFDCIFYFLENNIDDKSLPIEASLQKMFTRFESQILMCKKEKDSLCLDEHSKILLNFKKISIENLDDTACFLRRNTSLKILQHSLILMRKYFNEQDIWSQLEFETLFKVFYDKFESNKVLLLEIMVFVPRDVIKSKKISKLYLDELLSSIKPARSLTAAYIILYNIRYSILSFDIELKDCSFIQTEAFKAAIYCESSLMKALLLAEKSILVSAGSNPMYGQVQSIRFIIQHLNLNELEDCEKWREFFCRLINVCKRLTSVVAKIVNSSAPEGMTIEEDILALDTVDVNIKKVIENTTPQMVVLCGYRIVKEVSLLLGDITLRSSLKLIDIDKTFDIGYHLLELLSSTKHRGAFEQCFFGFSQFCFSLNERNVPEIRNWRTEILTSQIESLKSFQEMEILDKAQVGVKNLCATRRSAGLPFIVQAIVVSEIKISQSENVHFVMKSLIDILKETAKQHESKVHALNILRALFRCKELNTVIDEYVSKSFECAIIGFGAKDWSERNSSTLLFSTLMVRTFGIDVNIRNRMNAKAFFLRYPGLDSFIHHQLNEAAALIVFQRLKPQLYPTMLLLNKLCATPSERLEANVRMEKFISLVEPCLGSIELKTRMLCAKFIANVVSPISKVDRIILKLNAIEKDPLPINLMHGKLLEVLYICESIEKKDISPQSLFILNKMFLFLSMLKSQPICYHVLLDIIIEIFEKNLNDPRLMTCEIIEKLNFCGDFDLKSTVYGAEMMQTKLMNINLIRVVLGCEINFLLNLDLNMKTNELMTKLDCIIMMLDINYSKEIMDDYDIDSKTVFFIENMPSEIVEKCILKIKDSDELRTNLMKIKDYGFNNAKVRAFEILSYFKPSKDQGFQEIIALFESINIKSEDLSRAMLKYINNFLHYNQDYIETIDDWKFLPDLALNSSFTVK